MSISDQYHLTERGAAASPASRVVGSRSGSNGVTCCSGGTSSFPRPAPVLLSLRGHFTWSTSLLCAWRLVAGASAGLSGRTPGGLRPHVS